MRCRSCWRESAWLNLLLIAGTFTPTSSGHSDESRSQFYDHYNPSGPSYNKGAPPTLVYRFLEQSMSRGCTVSIKCIATGNPTPSIKWLMDGFKPPTSERFMIGQYVTLNGDVISHFNVSSCSSEDSAEISCSAKNDLGATTHKARLNIFGPPFVRDFGRVESAVSGKDFSVKCPVGGYPIDHINWFREQKQLPLTSRQAASLDGTLTIKNVQKSDKGNYTCTAKYKDLTHSNTLQINVVVPPKLTYFRPERVVEAGERIVEYCEAAGDPPIELEWLQDGMTLDPSSHPHITIQHIGVGIVLVLIITQVPPHFSQSNFTCIARNEGKSPPKGNENNLPQKQVTYFMKFTVGEDRLTTKLIVQVSPSVTKFEFPEALEGMRVSVHCAISNYAQDVTFVWLKDDRVISGGGQGTRVLQLDPFSSILSIENVSLVNAGNYSCVVSNPHGNASHTAELTVFVPPKWTTEPMDIEGVEGERIVSHCGADAFPPPTITWKKALAGRPGSYTDIPRHQGKGLAVAAHGSAPITLPNGTLLIPAASALGDGKVLRLVCEAENGIGPGISKLIHLRINAPVKIQQSTLKNVTLRSGNSGTVRCVVTGDFPIHLNWFHGQEEVIPLINYRYQIKSVNTSSGVSSELTLTNVKQKDSIRPFLCIAKNLCSSVCRIEQQEMWLIVLDPPETPQNLTVLQKQSRFVELGWKFRREATDTFTRILIKQKINGGPWSTISMTNERREADEVGSMSSLISDLRPATTYHFTVTALNVIGSSESKEVTVITSEEPPDQTLKNLIATALSATQVKVMWDLLSWSNGEIIGYNIGLRKASEGGPFKFVTIEAPTTETVFHNLHSFTRYEVVGGAYNAMGQGPLSKPTLVSTFESVPTSPKGLNCYTLTSQKLQVSWNGMTSEESRGVLKGYRIFVQRAQIDLLLRDNLIVINTTADDTSSIVDNLSKYTMYEVQILAYTNKGDGDLSPSVFCQTEEDIPGNPEQVKLIRTDATSAILAWSPPLYTELNGEITHYTVYFQGESGRRVPPNITQIEVQPARFHPFQAHVSASTKMGEGGNATISYHPDGIGGGLISFGRTIHLAFRTNLTLTCITAIGRPLRTWFFQSKIIQENERKHTEAQGAILKINSVLEDESGNYSCFQPSYTWEGIQFKPERISYKLIVQAPPPAPKLREHDISHHFVSLRWAVKDGGRGTVVEGYLLHIKVMDEWLERKLPRRLTSYVLRDLNCGTVYPIYLTAYNKAGMSGPSQLLNISTKGGRPTMTVSPDSLVDVNNTWIRLNLHEAFSDGGCPIVAYRVLYRKNYNELHWKSVDEHLSNGKRHVNLTGLEESTNYLIKIWAENESGKMEMTFPVRTLGIVAAPSNNLMKSVSDSLYFNFKIIGPIVLAGLLLLILVSAVLIVCKKRTFHGEGEEPTGDAFTYFKQNVHNSHSQQNQVYMTVKKSTPSKATSNDFDLIPHSPDGVNPYATFELKNSSTGHRPRRKRGGPRPAQAADPNPFYISKDSHICNMKKRQIYGDDDGPSDEEGEEEEYESIPSDSESFKVPRRSLPFDQIQNCGDRYTNLYEPALKPTNHKRHCRETEMYLEDKSCRVKHKRGNDSYAPRDGFRKPRVRNPGALVLCDEPPPQFGEEDLCQIKV